jgi:RimJ/RimL family protein N-acetyltransferase
MPAILLRDIIESDLPILFEQQNDPAACRMAAVPFRPLDAFLDHWSKILANETIQKQTILFEGQIAGMLVCFERDHEREVGYWLGRAFWGKGIASLALGLFLPMIPDRPLHAFAAHNPGSIRVLEKNGFRVIGTERASSDVPGVEIEGKLFLLEK